MRQEHFKIVQEYIEDNLSLSDTDIADLILEDRGLDKSHRTLRRYVSQAKERLGITKLAKTKISASTSTKTLSKEKSKESEKPKELEESKESEVLKEEEEEEEIIEVDGVFYYNLKYNKDIMKMSVIIVDQIFCAYSKKGLNYSGPSIMSVLEVNKKVFSTLVAKLGLSKESEPLSPFTLTVLSAVKQNERIAELTGELLEKFAESDSGIAEGIVKEYKKKYTDLVFNSNQKREVYEHIIDKLPQIKLSKYNYKAKFESDLPLYVVIGDMHIGMEASTFNYEKAKEALTTMSFEINALVENKGYNDVYLLFLGDIPHTVSGVNHANMWKDIEPGLWGADAIIKPYELLIEFMSNTHNITKIYAVGGNHGRLADRKELEPTDEGEKLIFYMIQNTFKSIEVVWDPDKVIFKRGNMTFILLHGDQRQDTRPGQEIAWGLGNGNTYNLILVGHTHSRQIAKNDDGDNYRKMVCPAFCPTDSYAERLGYKSLPGYILITEDRNGYPIIADHPLHYQKD